MKNKGALCISLDFEKFWGIHDVSNLKDVEQQLSKVSAVVERLLKLFTKYDIHCTWAVVGMMNFESLVELETFSKPISINYTQQEFSPLPISKFNLNSFDSNTFLAKADIDLIKNTNNQELASHTFSHLYSIEKGVSETDFKNDIDFFKKTVGEFKSIVFPRNQVNIDYLKLLAKNGVLTYRGNQQNRFWKNSDFKAESVFKKIGRTLDAYLKITKDNLIDWQELKQNNSGLVNISASRFLKPYQFNSIIEKLKINRIKKQMTKAALANKIYHLWWHPHNFATNSTQNFEQLDQILIHYKSLQKKYNFESLNMNEIALKVG